MNSYKNIINNTISITDFDDKYFINYLDKKSKNISKKYKYVRHKVLVIPYLKYENQEIKFLIVKDAKFNEWTFISGCVEKKENNFKTASRELFEETKQIININITSNNCIYFETILYENNIKFVYHVHLINLSKSNCISEQKIIDQFYSKKIIDKKYNENTDLCFKSYSEICKIDNVWTFIRSNILDNFFFEKLIHEL